MSSAGQVSSYTDGHDALLAAEIGSGRLEGAEPDGAVAALAAAFASGKIDADEFTTAVAEHQHAVVEQARQRLYVVDGE